MSIVLTKAALALKGAESNFIAVKYESYKPKKKQSSENETKAESHGQLMHTKKDLDLKRIRHEVVKFGMSGFDGTKKEEAKIALAVSLGAKPPKREYINYKELMQKRKFEKLKQNQEKQLMISKTIMQSTGKKKKKGTNNDVGHFLDNYGKVQKKDLKNNKKSSVKKKKK